MRHVLQIIVVFGLNIYERSQIKVETIANAILSASIKHKIK